MCSFLVGWWNSLITWIYMPVVCLKGILGTEGRHWLFLEVWWVTYAWVAQLPVAIVKMETHPTGLEVECPLLGCLSGEAGGGRTFWSTLHCTCGDLLVEVLILFWPAQGGPLLLRLVAQNLLSSAVPAPCCDTWRGENLQSSMTGDPALFPCCLRWRRDSSTHSFGRLSSLGRSTYLAKKNLPLEPPHYIRMWCLIRRVHQGSHGGQYVKIWLVLGCLLPS